MCLYMGICTFVCEPLEAKDVNIPPGTKLQTELRVAGCASWEPTSVEDKAVDRPAGVGALDLTVSFRLRNSFCV